MNALAIPFPNISPEIFQIGIGSFSFALRWYALAYIAGILIGWRLVLHALKRPALWPDDKPPMTAEQLENLLTWIIVGVILGGRMGYVLFYQPGYFLSQPQKIIAVWEGGMSFHGGFLGVVIATWLFSRRHGLAVASLADAMALAAPPGLFLGRIANFINAELWGRPSRLPWAVIFPGERAQDCAGHALAAGGLCARHPSQLYEAALEGVLLGSLLLVLAFRRGWLKRPGAIAGTFFAGYGLSRFLVEFVRQPDAQFVGPGNPLGLALHLGGYGLTMGQLLSLPMILIGLAVILRSRRQGA